MPADINDDLYTRAVVSYVQWRCDAMDVLQQSIAAKPEFAQGHAVHGLLLHMARNSSYRVLMEAARDRARQHLSDCPIEKLYVCGLEAACSGELMRMVCCFEEVLLHDPHDIFALRMCQGELFWLGEMRWSETISASVAEQWHDSIPNYGTFLSCRAFDLEETGHYQMAEHCGRQAVERDGSDPWGAHAVAHVMFMQGRFIEGEQWLEGLRDNWSGISQIALHLWWHRALFSLEQGDLAGALEIYDSYVRNLQLDMIIELPDLYIDMQNAASLLVRLELLGLSVQQRWGELAEIATGRITDHSNPFTSAHFALILAADARWVEVDLLLESLQQAAMSSGTLAPRIATAALPAAIAGMAHRRGDHAAVVDVLWPARHQLWQMGGSHAQRELFFLLLADSLRKLGKTDQLAVVGRDIEAAGFADSMAQRFVA